MANNENLRTPTSKQAREYGRKGGIASAKKRAERKTMQEMLKYLLEMDITNQKGETKNTLEVIMTAQIREAAKGNTKAAQFIRDTIGEQPAIEFNMPESLFINVVNKED